MGDIDTWTGTVKLSGTNYILNSGSSPYYTGIAPPSGIGFTFYGISTTNKINGPPIPRGTDIYEQWGTNPIVPINQKMGPSNTYIDKIGQLWPDPTNAPRFPSNTSPSATTFIFSPPTPIPPLTIKPASGTVKVYAPSNTYRGTISRTIWIMNTSTNSRTNATMSVTAH